MTLLYNRGIELTLARPQTFDFFDVLPNAKLITDLRVQFTINKTLEATSNKASIKVTNLSEASRGATEERPLHVSLACGYDGQLETIFTGDVYYASSVRNEADWVTTLEFGEGNRAMKHARLSQSFKSGTTSKTVIKKLAADMNLKIPSSFAEAKEFTKQFAAGITLQGLSSSSLTTVLKRHKMGWSIQDGQLQILRENDVRADEAWVINTASGMVGSPHFGTPQKKGKPPVLTVKALMFPRILPGGKIKVESKRVNGIFKALTVNHTGDTAGKDWYTTVQAVAI